MQTSAFESNVTTLRKLSRTHMIIDKKRFLSGVCVCVCVCVCACVCDIVATWVEKVKIMQSWRLHTIDDNYTTLYSFCRPTKFRCKRATAADSQGTDRTMLHARQHTDEQYGWDGDALDYRETQMPPTEVDKRIADLEFCSKASSSHFGRLLFVVCDVRLLCCFGAPTFRLKHHVETRTCRVDGSVVGDAAAVCVDLGSHVVRTVVHFYVVKRTTTHTHTPTHTVTQSLSYSE